MELIPPDTKIDFMGNRHYAYLFSGIMAVLCIVAIVVKGHIRLGIDFSGGTMVQVKFSKPVHTDEVREALKPLGENLMVQQLGGAEEFIIRLEASEETASMMSQQVKDLLEKKTGKDTVEIRSTEMVGPKVGKDLREHAIWATVIALVLLLIYMAFRFTFTMGLGAIACLVHDLLILYGFFVITGKEFNLTILAAWLTVVGYDVNDTIVVCDRVRDNLKLMKKSSLVGHIQHFHQSDPVSNGA